MSKKQSEAITDYVGRVLEIRKLLVLADSASAPTDIAVKQVILKGLPSSFNPIKIPYLYGPEAASLAGMSVADIMGFLRVYEADLARDSRPGPSRAVPLQLNIARIATVMVMKKSSVSKSDVTSVSVMSVKRLRPSVLCTRHQILWR